LFKFVRNIYRNLNVHYELVYNSSLYRLFYLWPLGLIPLNMDIV